MICGERPKGKSCKLKEYRSRLNKRKTFFTMRVVRHLNRLPRAAVDILYLKMFKDRLDEI